jgi:predicted enzyme related to lactoylglutathione lyase
MNPVVHFEMPAKDRKRVAAFYEKAFGWKMQAMGPEMNNYITAQTTPAGDDARPAEPGAINGGFYEVDATEGNRGPSFVIAVDDVDTALQSITDAGGTILSEPVDIPGVGRYAWFSDTEGNRNSILKPSR